MYVVSSGMVCPVGLTAESACAAIRAGIDMFEELSYVDNYSEPIIGATVPGLDPELKRKERLIEMLIAAIEDCISHHNSILFDNIPIFVSLAEPNRPGGCSGLADSVVGEIENRLNVKFHPKYSEAITSGHTSGFEALARARELMANQQISTCLICGVDSYINASSLLWLDKHWRLKTKENSDGVIPGEAACSIFVNSEKIYNNKFQNVFIEGVGISTDNVNVYDEAPITGRGLANAIKKALGQASIKYHEVDLIMTDVTGESYFFKEQMYARMRLQREKFTKYVDMCHVAEYIGDIGSVSGICQLALLNNLKQSTACNVLCTTSNVNNAKASIVASLE